MIFFRYVLLAKPLGIRLNGFGFIMLQCALRTSALLVLLKHDAYEPSLFYAVSLSYSLKLACQ